MRLLKYLVDCGLASRKVIINKVRSGEITVNGNTVYDERMDIYDGDVILHLGNELSKKELKYYALHKTMGHITAMKDENRATVVELLPDDFDTESFFPIGRLDKDTEGVLIFTNDGELNKKMSQPENKVEKEYYVELLNDINEEALDELRTGVSIQDHDCLPAKAKKLSDRIITLTIVEGKFHQVKRMLKSVGNEVTYLKRIKFGKLHLGDLPKGRLKEISLAELI